MMNEAYYKRTAKYIKEDVELRGETGRVIYDIEVDGDRKYETRVRLGLDLITEASMKPTGVEFLGDREMWRKISIVSAKVELIEAVDVNGDPIPVDYDTKLLEHYLLNV